MKKIIFVLVAVLPFLKNANVQAQIRNAGVGKKNIQLNNASQPNRIAKFTNYKTSAAYALKPVLSNALVKTIVRKNATDKNTYRSTVITGLTKTKTNGDKICKTEYRKLDVTNLTQDVLNPDDISALQLGGIYNLTDFKNGNYNNVTEPRNPISLSIMGLKSVKIEHPDDASLADGLSQLLSTPFVVRPAGSGQYYECKIVNTQTELEIAAGVSYSGGTFSAATTFNYNQSSTNNKFLVTYIYPIFTTQVIGNKNYFENAALNADQNLVVIDKISYGAKLMVFFESELDEKTITATLSGSGWGAKANLSAEQRSQLDKITYKVFLYGSNTPVQIVKGYDELFAKTQQMITGVCDKSKRFPLELGAPISYSLKFLNGDIAATNCNANELPSQVCTNNPNIPMNLTVSLQSLKMEGGNHFGWIDFEILDANHNRRGNDIKTVWNVNRDQATYQNQGGMDAVSTINFNQINAADRQNGYLRIWTRLQNRKIGGPDAFLVKSDNPNPDEGLNGMHGSYKAQFYDIKLTDIMNVRPNTQFNSTLMRSSGNDKKMSIEIHAWFN